MLGGAFGLSEAQTMWLCETCDCSYGSEECKNARESFQAKIILKEI